MGESSLENPTKSEYLLGRKLPLNQTQIDMLSGITTGMVATFVSHPLDTVKVRFQTSNSAEMTLRMCISDVYMREGVSRLIYFVVPNL